MVKVESACCAHAFINNSLCGILAGVAPLVMSWWQWPALRWCGGGVVVVVVAWRAARAPLASHRRRRSMWRLEAAARGDPSPLRIRDLALSRSRDRLVLSLDHLSRSRDHLALGLCACSLAYHVPLM